MKLEQMNGKASPTPSLGGGGGRFQSDGEEDDGGFRMKKEVGLVEGVAIIIGIIIGSGEAHTNDKL